MSKDAYYFSHDSNAINDPKIADMIFDYHMEGYGLFWVVIERLRESENYKLELNRATFRNLARLTMLDIDIIKKFLEDCINEYGLFKLENNYFYSYSLLTRMEKLNETRQKRKEAIAKRWGKKEENNTNLYNSNTNVLQMNDDSNSNEIQIDTKKSKVKESKSNQSKVKESKVNQIKSNHSIEDDDIDGFDLIDDCSLSNFSSLLSNLKISETEILDLKKIASDKEIIEAARKSKEYNVKSPLNYIKTIIENNRKNNISNNLFEDMVKNMKEGVDPF